MSYKNTKKYQKNLYIYKFLSLSKFFTTGVKIFKSPLSKFFTTGVKIFKSSLSKFFTTRKSMTYEFKNRYIYRPCVRAQKIRIYYYVIYILNILVTTRTLARASGLVGLYVLNKNTKASRNTVYTLGVDKIAGSAHTLDVDKIAGSAHTLDVDKIAGSAHTLDFIGWFICAVLKIHSFVVYKLHGFFSFKGIRVRGSVFC